MQLSLFTNINCVANWRQDVLISWLVRLLCSIRQCGYFGVIFIVCTISYPRKIEFPSTWGLLFVIVIVMYLSVNMKFARCRPIIGCSHRGWFPNDATPSTGIYRTRSVSGVWPIQTDAISTEQSETCPSHRWRYLLATDWYVHLNRHHRSNTARVQLAERHTKVDRSKSLLSISWGGERNLEKGLVILTSSRVSVSVISLPISTRTCTNMTCCSVHYLQWRWSLAF